MKKLDGKVGLKYRHCRKRGCFRGGMTHFKYLGKKKSVRYMLRRGRGGGGWETRGREGEGGAAEASPHFPGPRSKPEGAGTGFNHSLLFQKCLNGEMLTLWLLLPMACGAPDLADQAQFCSCISNYLQNMMVIFLIILNLYNLAQQIFCKSKFSFFCPPGPGDNLSERRDSPSALRHQQQQPWRPSHSSPLVQGGPLRAEQGDGLPHLSDRCAD